jgi:hypothetical protein
MQQYLGHSEAGIVKHLFSKKAKCDKLWSLAYSEAIRSQPHHAFSWNNKKVQAACIRIKSPVLQIIPEGVHIGDVEDQPLSESLLPPLPDLRSQIVRLSRAAKETTFSPP